MTMAQLQQTRPQQPGAAFAPPAPRPAVSASRVVPEGRLVTPGFHFGAVPLFAQARLEVGRTDDPLEREADRVAEAVVSGAGPSEARAVPGSARGFPGIPVQRQEADEPAADAEPSVVESGEEIGTPPEAVEEEDREQVTGDESGRPKLVDGAPPPSTALRLPRGEGRPLDPATREVVEERMGHAFGQVRVHTGRAAARAAEGIRAHAFTVGNDIYFNEGRYAPTAAPGLRLLAHELAHVVQQSASGGVSRGEVIRLAPQDRGRSRGTRRPRRRGDGSPCTGACAPSKVDRLVRNDCNSGSPAVAGRWIRHLLVERGSHWVTATWSNGRTERWPCSPSTRSGPGGKVPTPLGNDVVGDKCSNCHTNRFRDGMGYFTGFRSHGRAIGFHNSQLVGAAYESHGCVRVGCGVARTIRDHSTSGTTTIRVVA